MSKSEAELADARRHVVARLDDHGALALHLVGVDEVEGEALLAADVGDLQGERDVAEPALRALACNV
jgi:hypothetical protein